MFWELLVYDSKRSEDIEDTKNWQLLRSVTLDSRNVSHIITKSIAQDSLRWTEEWTLVGFKLKAAVLCSFPACLYFSRVTHTHTHTQIYPASKKFRRDFSAPPRHAPAIPRSNGLKKPVYTPSRNAVWSVWYVHLTI